MKRLWSLLLNHQAFLEVSDKVFQLTRQSRPPDRLSGSLAACSNALMTTMEFFEECFSERRRDENTTSWK